MLRSRKVISALAAVAVLGGGTAIVAVTTPSGPSGASVPVDAVQFPAGFQNPIFVGPDQVYPTSTTGGTTSTTTTPTTSSSTTTTAPPQSSTSSSVTSTSSPTTSTAATTSTTTSTSVPATTTSTVAATTTTVPSAPGCGLSSAAFCETFDQPHNGGTQTGDLDPVLWGASRVADIDPGQGKFDAVAQSTNPCGTGLIKPPADIRVCNGQMVESVNDGGIVVNLDTYPKQPFDFTGRTGKVVFDVSADSDNGHAAWPEFVITDAPVPGTRAVAGGAHPVNALNEIGFTLDGESGCNTSGRTGIGVIFKSIGGVYSESKVPMLGCITKGSRNAMNHFEVRVSASDIEVWATDAGQQNLHQLGAWHTLGLTFTSGLVWLNDAHYNARKGNASETGTQFDHAFAWDNLGFDGPKTYRDWGFDVPYANTQGPNSGHGDILWNEGYKVGLSKALPMTSPVTLSPLTTKVRVVLNSYACAPGNIKITVNGHLESAPPHVQTNNCFWDAWSIVLDNISDVKAGPNAITVTSDDASTVVANVSIILVAAGSVP